MNCLQLAYALVFSVGFALPIHVSAEESRAEAVSFELTEPLNYQVIQRSAQETTIQVKGRVSEEIAARTTSTEIRMIGAGEDLETWRKAPSSASQSHSTALAHEIQAPPGGWYRIEVRLKAGDRILAETAVEHVGIGEIFIVAGQSNAANHGEERLQPQTGRVAAFNGNSWALANDPQPLASGEGGSFIPAFGDALVEKLEVPIGMISVAVGATSVREWLPKGIPFPNPPTITANVVELPSGEWESTGTLFQRLLAEASKPARAILWHQGESDANQADPSRTLNGDLYRKLLRRLILETQRSSHQATPWFVAQVSYHSPEATGSESIRAAQTALWEAGDALQGPDTDSLVGHFRDNGGLGIHFSGEGLREHGQLWAQKIIPWIETQLTSTASTTQTARPAIGENVAGYGSGNIPGKLNLPREEFEVNERPAFALLPEDGKRSTPQPWIFYAPTLPGYPDEAERWMHERFLAAGIAVAGVDVGEAYGSPRSHAAFEALYAELATRFTFSQKPCLLGRSRGGLWVTSWASAHPERVAGIAGIYPVFDFTTYPGLEKAAPAYGLTSEELEAQSADLNPINRVPAIAEADLPVLLLHGTADSVVPYPENTLAFFRHYEDVEKEHLVNVITFPGEGHNYADVFFRSQELVDFVIAQARAGAEE